MKEESARSRNDSEVSGCVYGIENMIAIYINMAQRKPQWLESDSELIAQTPSVPVLVTFSQEEASHQLQQRQNQPFSYKIHNKVDHFRVKPKTTTNAELSSCFLKNEFDGAYDENISKEGVYMGRIPICSVKKPAHVVVKDVIVNDKKILKNNEITNLIADEIKDNGHISDDMHSAKSSGIHSRQGSDLLVFKEPLNHPSSNNQHPTTILSNKLSTKEVELKKTIVVDDEKNKTIDLIDIGNSLNKIINSYVTSENVKIDDIKVTKSEKNEDISEVVIKTENSIKVENLNEKVIENTVQMQSNKKNNQPKNQKKQKGNANQSNTASKTTNSIKPYPKTNNVSVTSIPPVSLKKIEAEQMREHSESIRANKQNKSSEIPPKKSTGLQKWANNTQNVQTASVIQKKSGKKNTQSQKSKTKLEKQADKEFWDIADNHVITN